jgi:dTDP-3-amino-3,6-dideoxy-alpha-D-glucopyranose N,N-dimethyltransferase/dTDP-3-amino-3,4,6-trideoxy-alpha-D-glucopyranose N,N-dimethyltransferase
MYAESHVDVYDLVYEGRGKDYRKEVDQVLGLVRERAGAPGSLLDVACGTGGHLRYFAEQVSLVEGLEISPVMIAAAHRRLSGVRVHQGDMKGFDLGRNYSAVVCMFSSIGHLRDTGELRAALKAFARHVEPGGTVLIEPWWFPEDFIDGYIAADVVRDGDRVVSRVSHSVERNGFTFMEIHFLMADPDTGVRHSVDRQEIRLFRRTEYEAAFAEAGLSCEFLADFPSRRGMFIGTR